MRANLTDPGAPTAEGIGVRRAPLPLRRLPAAPKPVVAEAAANQWNPRALPQNSAERVLPGGVPQAHLRLDRRAARGSRRVDQELQRKQTPSRPLVFGKTPMQTFLDATPLAKEKLIAA